jgi:hypothetical protein
VLAEPLLDEIDEAAVTERVGRARRHLHHRGFRLRTAGCRVDHGGDDEVDGDDVDHTLGDAGELLQQPARVADDDRLGHAEAADPSRAGLGDRRLDDRGTHDGDGHVAACLEQGLLAECLGVRVGVGPAERRGARASGFDELIVHPALAELLGTRREQRDAGGAQLGPGVLVEAREHRRRPAACLDVGPGATGGVDLAPPVDVGCERLVREGQFGGLAPPVAGDVTRRDRDEVGGGSDVAERLGDATRAEEVDLDGAVERRVERDRRRRVDDRVDPSQELEALVVETEQVATDVAGDDPDPPRREGVEVVDLGPQAVEGVVA